MENIYETDWDATQDQPGFEWHRIRLASRLGGEMVGASIYVIEPGQKSFPYHFHHGNEEMLIVLEGQVTVRTPEGEEPAGPSHSRCANLCPAGLASHQALKVARICSRLSAL